MNQPLVSVLMTSYNTSKYIQFAIESLLKQTYTNWELLIADDCSTDSTREVIAGFSDARIHIFHNDHNLHYLRTRNKLVQHAKGDFIALLDSDDLYAPKKLELQIEEFNNDPALMLCGTLVAFMDSEGKRLETMDSKPLVDSEIREAIKEKNVFTGSTIMVKTTVWREFGGYRDFFNTLGYEDYDLTSRIIEKYKVKNIDLALYDYRQYPESTSRRDMLYNPFKLNGHLLIQHFIKQRAEEGSDSLAKNDIPAIINFIVQKNKPYVDDPSLIHREVMWAYVHKKLHGLAFTHIIKALSMKPLSWSNYRTFVLLLLISTGLRKE